MNIASLIDHSLLKPIVTIAEIEMLCTEAIKHGFRAVVVPPLFVKRSREILNDSKVKVITATGFPFGYSAIEAKLAETILAIVDGADEIEMMINLAALKNADWQYLAKEINTILPIVRAREKKMNVILETGSLTDNEMITCCDIYGAAGVDTIKTSTGFADKGTTVEAVKLLRRHLADAIQINASGEINSYELAKKLLDAGAAIITPANGLQIIKEAAVLI